MSNILLNFLALNNSNFVFDIYRKQYSENADSDLYTCYLPTGKDIHEKTNYFISFDDLEGFEKVSINSEQSLSLTKRLLYQSLFTEISRDPPFPLRTYDRPYQSNRVEFIVEQFEEGDRIVMLSPYFLESRGQFGFLIDFRFAKKLAITHSGRVQQLSFSLDVKGKSNKDFYSDKFSILKKFLAKAAPRFTGIPFIGENSDSFTLENTMSSISSSSLEKKTYLFNNSNTSYSQFQGIKNYGPYKALEKDVVFIFLFEKKYKSFANELYLSLIGKSNPGTFSGFKQMFKLPFSVENVRQISIEEYDQKSLEILINHVLEARKSEQDKLFIGVFIENYLGAEDTTSSEAYYFLKYHFIKENFPLQVVNYNKLGIKNALKWSTSNLALQMFSKLGGIPWIVRPSNNDCLILGVGSAHKRDQEGNISKFFAYTICLDSSGLYKQLKILAESEDNDTYLEQLGENLKELLSIEEFKDYKKCVLHLPFKIKKREIDVLRSVVEEINDKKFIAIKINTENKFFGFSDHNTLVPYESTYVQLGKYQFLVWFEGLQYGKEVVYKRLANPVHVEFLRLGDEKINLQSYLQDVLNLSGANWRGFNAKSVPISIYYSKLIADYAKMFEDISDYDESAISNEHPWFL